MDRDDWNQRYQAVPLLWKVDPQSFLGQELADLAPGRALDLGAGEGRNAIGLAGRGWRVTAVDFSDVAMARARRLAQQAGVDGSITWVEADLAEFDVEVVAYDLVLLMFVHLQATDRRRLLRRAVDSLAPGGTVLVVGYHTDNATEGTEGVRDPPVLFSPEHIVAELDGVHVVRAERLPVGNAVDTIVRAVKP